jgi:hypothetical protein
MNGQGRIRAVATTRALFLTPQVAACCVLRDEMRTAIIPSLHSCVFLSLVRSWFCFGQAAYTNRKAFCRPPTHPLRHKWLAVALRTARLDVTRGLFEAEWLGLMKHAGFGGLWRMPAKRSSQARTVGGGSAIEAEGSGQETEISAQHRHLYIDQLRKLDRPQSY